VEKHRTVALATREVPCSSTSSGKWPAVSIAGHGIQSRRVLAGSRVAAQILITHWMNNSAQI